MIVGHNFLPSGIDDFLGGLEDSPAVDELDSSKMSEVADLATRNKN